MGNLDEYQNERLANDPVIRLHVEGKTDREMILEWWLEKADRELRILFAEVVFATESREQTRLQGAASGCTEVRKRLEADLDEPAIVAMGLVDRDYLLTKEDMDAFLEPDDAAFERAASDAVGERLAGRLWVLGRWELENYLLLDLDVLSELVRCTAKASGDHSPAGVEQRLHELVDEQTPLVARSLHLVESAVPLRALMGADDADGQGAMVRLVDSEALVSIGQRAVFEAKLAKFEGGVSVTERWSARSRVADGKWLLARLSKRIVREPSVQLRRLLARDVGNKHRGPPPEVVTLLRRMQAVAVEMARRQVAPSP